ncbi:unnamed protein product [Ciceribacter sp. T2.26MG-112.2]|nr:unnamed protein product [Ciceribacter naphthalenivorans]
MQAAKRLARQDMQTDGDQRPGIAIEQPVRLGRAHQPVSQKAARAANGRDLGILVEGIDDLAIAGLDLAAQVMNADPVFAGHLVHPDHQILQRVADHEVLSLVHERLDRAGRVPAQPLQQQGNVLARQVRILLGARKGEFALDDRLVEDEPAILVAPGADRLQRGQGIEPRQGGWRKTVAVGVTPEGRRAGQDADTVVRPDRIEVPEAFGVVPHPVAVDDVGAGRPRNGQHPPVDILRHARDHRSWRGAEPLDRPVLANQIVIAADPSGGDDDRAGRNLEVSDHRARCRCSPRRGIDRQYTAARPCDCAVAPRELVDLMAEPEHQPSRPLGLARPADEGLQHGRAGPPGDMETGNRIAVAVRLGATSFRPADNGKKAYALPVQPVALFACGKF